MCHSEVLDGLCRNAAKGRTAVGHLLGYWRRLGPAGGAGVPALSVRFRRLASIALGLGPGCGVLEERKAQRVPPLPQLGPCGERAGFPVTNLSENLVRSTGPQA